MKHLLIAGLIATSLTGCAMTPEQSANFRAGAMAVTAGLLAGAAVATAPRTVYVEPVYVVPVRRCYYRPCY